MSKAAAVQEMQYRVGLDQFACLKGFALVRRDVQVIDQPSKAGLVKPQTAQDKPQWGTVVGIASDEDELQVGDRVFFSKYVTGEVEPFPGDIIIHLHKTNIYLYPKRRIQ